MVLYGGLWQLLRWRPHGDSNPGYRRERAMNALCNQGALDGEANCGLRVLPQDLVSIALGRAQVRVPGVELHGPDRNPGEQHVTDEGVAQRVQASLQAGVARIAQESPRERFFPDPGEDIRPRLFQRSQRLRSPCRARNFPPLGILRAFLACRKDAE